MRTVATYLLAIVFGGFLALGINFSHAQSTNSPANPQQTPRTTPTPPMPPGPNPNSQYRLGPDSLPQEGVPKGEIRGPFTLPSNAYPGTQHTYWIYVPANITLQCRQR